MRWLFLYVAVYISPLPRQAVEESRKKYERLLSATHETLLIDIFAAVTNCDTQDLFRARDHVISLDCNALWDPQLLLPAISYAAFKHAGSLL